jgi:hypothetical protein
MIQLNMMNFKPQEDDYSELPHLLLAGALWGQQQIVRLFADQEF